ncbi:MAG TPA: hypothetical protein VHO66_03310 [Ruminiclostridium sp.]|nr:hypothetical protein [Ruminiclostridium sp.]
MKKMSFILFLCAIVFCNRANAANVANKCPQGKYKISNSVSRAVQKYTGLNFLSSFTVKEIAEMNVSKLMKSKETELDVDLYSTGDFLSGKIKGFSAYLKDFSVEDFYITEVKAKSLCSYTDIDYRKAPPKTKTPMFIEFSSTLTEKDLLKTFTSPNYSKLLSSIPLMIDNTEIGKLKINSLYTKLKKDKFVITSVIACEAGFLKYEFPIAFESSVEAKNNSIYLVNFKLTPDMFGKDFAFLSDFAKLDRIKIIDLNTAKSDPYHINIKKIAIQNGKITTDGTVYIPANTVFK